ncbi:MAG TPA: hypothetical protein VN329_16965, partial [Roseomonas sp.]|nr:hypothetical protein [Roseomonas sp.]
MSSSGVNLHELMQRVRDAIGGRDFVTVSLSRLEFAHVCAAADALQDAEEALFDFHASDSGVNG